MSSTPSSSLAPLARAPRAMGVLLALARRDARVLPALQSQLADPALQRELAALAQYHGLLGLTLLTLERTGLLATIPPSGADAYTRSLLFLRRQAALWDLERDAVLARLAERGIPTLLLKGAALRLTAYRDPVERPFGDIDILVPRDALDDAVAALTDRGYQGDPAERAQLYLDHHHHLILRKKPGFTVEIHWDLQPARSPLALDAAAFARSARVVATAAGTPVRVCAPEHLVLHVAAQQIEDGFARLRRLVDEDREIAAAPTFDWDRLAAEAARMRVRPMLALSLRLCELLLGTPVPPGFISRLEVSRAARAHLALLDPVGLVVARARTPRPAVHHLLLLWCIPDARTRRRVLRDMVTGAHDWFWEQLGEDGTRGGRVRHALAALKLAAYQMLLYPIATLGGARGARRARTFWGHDHPLPLAAPARESFALPHGTEVDSPPLPERRNRV